MTAAGLPRGPPPPPPPGTTHRPRRSHLWTPRHHPHAAGTTSHQRPATTAPIALRRVAPWDGCQVSGSTADSPDRKTARAEVAASVTPGLATRDKRQVTEMNVVDRPHGGWRARLLTAAEAEPMRTKFEEIGIPGDDVACWPWPGAKSERGYGFLFRKVDGRTVRYTAHRVAWVLGTGNEIPENLTIDHLCHNPSCVNPSHLEVVTLDENVRRGAIARGYLFHDPAEKARRRATPRPCPDCGEMSLPRNMARHIARRHADRRAA